MQPEYHSGTALFTKLTHTLPIHKISVFLFIFFGFSLGCRPTVVKVTDPKPEQSYRGTTLVIGVEEGVEKNALLAQFLAEWATRHDVTITTFNYPEKLQPGVSPDIMICRPATVPEVITHLGVLAVPSEIRVRDHKYQWDSLAGIHDGKLTRWDDQIMSVPLMGEGQLFVYRKDHFTTAGARVPETWEEMLQVAELLKQKGLPGLPPLGKHPLDLEREFYTIAASADRWERTQSDQSSAVVIDEAEADRLFSFHYRLQTSQARINTPAFVYALDTLRKLQAYRAEGSDPTETLIAGKASLSMVTLEQFARLQASGNAVKGKWGVAPLPGSRIVFDIDQQPLPNPNRLVNRTPYIGWGGWYGMVTTKCRAPEVAWNLLTDLGDPNRMGAEVIASAKWGVGPMRLTHVDPRQRNLWLGFDLSPEQTDRLIEVLRRNLATTVINYRVALRTPNQREHQHVLEIALRQALKTPTENSEAVLNRVAVNWENLWRGESATKKQEWIRFGLGLVR